MRWYLDLPEGVGPHPAVVLGPSSGSVSASHNITVDFARQLNRMGYAVMRYDKRGTGDSAGELVGVSTANGAVTIPLLAADMQAVMAQLLTDSRIDRSRVGLFGSSQAAWYMPVVAEAVPEVGFMIIVTGGVLPVGFQNQYEQRTRIDGLSQEEAEEEFGLLGEHTGPLGFDARPILRMLGIPLLYLLEGDDPAGPRPTNLVASEELIAEGLDLELKVYEGGRHTLPGVDFWADVEAWLERVN